MSKMDSKERLGNIIRLIANHPGIALTSLSREACRGWQRGHWSDRRQGYSGAEKGVSHAA